MRYLCPAAAVLLVCMCTMMHYTSASHHLRRIQQSQARNDAKKDDFSIQISYSITIVVDQEGNASDVTQTVTGSYSCQCTAAPCNCNTEDIRTTSPIPAPNQTAVPTPSTAPTQIPSSSQSPLPSPAASDSPSAFYTPSISPSQTTAPNQSTSPSLSAAPSQESTPAPTAAQNSTIPPTPTSCPSLPSNVICPAVYKPYICGNNLCLYDNKCSAIAAGWDTVANCTPWWDDSLNCRSPYKDFSCMGIYEPVFCGRFFCSYTSLCSAMNAGWRDNDCLPANSTSLVNETRICPTGKNASQCEMGNVEYTCGGIKCLYYSECAAVAAGWNIDNDCEGDPVCKYVDDSQCPPSRTSYTCGERDCFYSSECAASLAGWNASTQCTGMSACPTTSYWQTCETSNTSYFCGDNACMYMSACEANLTGWDVARECQVVEACKVADNTSYCEPSDMAYSCGPNPCTYAGECEAAAAGWNVSSECESFMTCPYVSYDGQCNDTNHSYICGELECRYMNGCEAITSGWDIELNCTEDYVCDPGDTIGSCPQTSLRNYVCGEKECFYLSTCSAEIGGWNTSVDCFEIPACTVAEWNVSCPDDLEPVVCSNQECRFDNQCYASAAGFNESECIDDSIYNSTTGGATAPPNITVISITRNVSNPDCKTPDPTWLCASKYEPVQCSKSGNTSSDMATVCVYSNECLATGAGWITNNECKTIVLSKTTPVVAINVTPVVTGKENGGCPVAGSGIMCTMEYAPVKCGFSNKQRKCEYSNACNAIAAGYAIDEHCEAVTFR
jgi:hypothetical protein